jgi:hypothetical protein
MDRMFAALEPIHPGEDFAAVYYASGEEAGIRLDEILAQALTA